MTTFIVFLLAFIVVLMLMARSTRRRQVGVADEMERVASEELPRIGAIAERAHSMRFGRPPTNVPVPAAAAAEKDDRPKSISWYPATKKVAAKRA